MRLKKRKGEWTTSLGALRKELKDTSPRHIPYVTFGLIAANVAMFIGTILELYGNPWRVGLTASEFIENPLTPKVFLAMFAHAGISHLLGNMFYLYKHGDNVEAAMGSLRYLVFYLICGYAAVAAQVLYSSAVGTPRLLLTPMVGASGAISGVLGAYLYLWPGASTYRCFCLQYTCYCVRLTARHDLSIWLAFQFLLIFVESSVAVFAHFGGLVAGIALAPIFAKWEYVERLRTEIERGEYQGLQPEEEEIKKRGWDVVVKIIVALVVLSVAVVTVLGFKGHAWHVYTLKLKPRGVVEELVTIGPPQPLRVEIVDSSIIVSHGPAGYAGILVSVALMMAILASIYYAAKLQKEWEVL